MAVTPGGGSRGPLEVAHEGGTDFGDGAHDRLWREAEQAVDPIEHGMCGRHGAFGVHGGWRDVQKRWAGRPYELWRARSRLFGGSPAGYGRWGDGYLTGA